jgi:hypothetical protein
LGDKGLIDFDQEKFRDPPTIIAAILIDWHMPSSRLSSLRRREDFLRLFCNGKIEIDEIDDTRES